MGGLVAALEYAVASGDGGVLAFRTMASPIPVPARDPPLGQALEHVEGPFFLTEMNSDPVVLHREAHSGRSFLGPDAAVGMLYFGDELDRV